MIFNWRLRQEGVTLKVISFYNIKGGVGKTTCAVNMAYQASKIGLRTILWDLDPQGSASFILRVQPKLKGRIEKFADANSPILKSVKETQWPLLDLIPSDFALRDLHYYLKDKKQHAKRLANSIEELDKEYDLVVVDCAPEASVVSENVIFFSDLICVPIIPNILSINSLETVLDFVKDSHGKKSKVSAIFNLVDRRKLLHRTVLEQYLNNDKRFLENYIPSSSAIEQMASLRAPVGAITSRRNKENPFFMVADELLHLLN